MRGYDREELHGGLEDYDEYEEEGEELEEDVGEAGEEEEYEGEEEEDPKPTKEEIEYLELRQRLKEQIRKQMNKDTSSSHNSSNDKKKKLPYDNYGSFFGPSQPVIAQRVIQESKSLLENPHLASRFSKSHHGVSTDKKNSSAATGSKPGSRDQLPKVRSELNTKVQKLKHTRDYSFLLSEDTELPVPTKEPPPRKVSVPHSEAASSQVPLKSKQPLSNSGRHVHGSREERKTVSMNGHLYPKAGPNKSTSVSKPNSASVDSKKQLGSNNGNGPGRPLVPKGLPLKKPAATMEKKASAPVARHSMAGVQKPLPSKVHPSISKQRLEPRKGLQEPNRSKMLPKQPMTSSKPQMNKPQKKIPSHPTSQEHRPKKKPVKRYPDDGDEDENAISLIRQMFGYNPGRYRDEGDDSDMEANFEDIMKEEKRSAKIARKEDEEQLRLIEEEEERERQARMRKLKKRKLG
ncbi:protein SPT2 homolog [Quercus lobata]|uniref:Protein SPT2 homolog n=1 Tax=Quercus lobata TaxID=97700 RepID=A0A7N2LYY8_QUELO|nr:protein SPT2 homolog [Quercus lobata]